ncbi:MAG: nicotinate-nucleotide--dimethylbenzimidazole phosphoribosyltransferase [Spirochaetae bacterium HGW-Spirochaetae-5]|nr:MAG: nicotinate-nucleotide--dimethylbenzimidazole phosphoribosyltransferase [Spirochaetae bacterium HGW-Spirochaetae-5]
MDLLKSTIEGIGPLNKEKMDEALERVNSLLKPPGSLGKLEDIAVQLSGITGKLHNTFKKKCIIVMAGDNGIVKEGVTSFPKDVSLLVAETMVGGISGVAVLARHAGAYLKVVDLGIDGDIKADGVIDRKIRKSTSSFLNGPAMSRNEAVRAIETGIEIANLAIREGADLIGTGEVGIGNTTTSSAMLYAYTGADPDIIVGRGAGLSDEGLARKKEVILQGVSFNKPDSSDPIDVLCKVGGFDIAGLTGVYIAAAAARIPVVIDGFISGVAALTAVKLAPGAKGYMFSSHGSVEPGARKVAELLGISPMLDMNMRLGEGTGCALAFNIIEASTKIINEMGTFSDIGM